MDENADQVEVLAKVQERIDAMREEMRALTVLLERAFALSD